MLTTLAIANYRSLRELIIPLGSLTLVTGANGSGKSSVYRALRLLTEVAQGRAIAALAREGGFASTLWAGPERPSDAREAPSRRSEPVNLKLGFAAEDIGYCIDLGRPQPGNSFFDGDPVIKRECIWIRDIGSVAADGSVIVTVRPESAHSTTREHQTLLRPFAAREVMNWVEERGQLEIPGQLLFPASLAGGKPLDKATVYRQVRKTFERAGLEMPRSGGRTLRNTFAVRELETGSVEQVSELLGLERTRSTEYYLDAARRRKRRSVQPRH